MTRSLILTCQKSQEHRSRTDVVGTGEALGRLRSRSAASAGARADQQERRVKGQQPLAPIFVPGSSPRTAPCRPDTRWGWQSEDGGHTETPRKPPQHHPRTGTTEPLQHRVTSTHTDRHTHTLGLSTRAGVVQGDLRGRQSIPQAAVTPGSAAQPTTSPNDTTQPDGTHIRHRSQSGGEHEPHASALCRHFGVHIHFHCSESVRG